MNSFAKPACPATRFRVSKNAIVLSTVFTPICKGWKQIVTLKSVLALAFEVKTGVTLVRRSGKAY